MTSFSDFAAGEVTGYLIGVNAGAGGTITPGAAVSVPFGGSQTFTIVPDNCHVIADVLVDSVSVGAISSYTFTNVQTNHTIAASFVALTYSITASAGAGGAITPNGNVTVACGASRSYAISANPSFQVADVRVDSVSVGPLTSYTFTNVTRAHTIQATFVPTSGSVGTGPVVFALEGARPNPVVGRDLNVTFALPTGTSARLELLGLNGRHVVTREVGLLGAGRHTVNLAEGRTLAPGLYWVRLSQGANRKTLRVTVLE